jgi:hypothetical protein
MTPTCYATKNPSKGKSTNNSSRQKKPAGELSKDEKTINRLKVRRLLL